MDKPPSRIKTVRLPNEPFMQSNGYKPAPLDLVAISLTPKMEELVDQLAENTHNLWAKERIQQQWTYGLNEVGILDFIDITLDNYSVCIDMVEHKIHIFCICSFADFDFEINMLLAQQHTVGVGPLHSISTVDILSPHEFLLPCF